MRVPFDCLNPPWCRGFLDWGAAEEVFRSLKIALHAARQYRSADSSPSRAFVQPIENPSSLIGMLRMRCPLAA